MTPDEVAILHEVGRIEREAGYASDTFAAAAEWWTRIMYGVSVPAALLTILAGSALFARAVPAPTAAASVALIASGLTLLLTVLAPRDKVASYKQAATRFNNLRNDASIMRNARPYLAKSESPLPVLTDLARRQNELTNDAPLLSSWVRRRLAKDAAPDSESLSRPSVRSFPGVADVYHYIAGRVEESARTIDDITWGSRKVYRTPQEAQAYEGYVESVKHACERPDVVYREISTLSNKHYFERALALMQAYGYHLAFYDTTECSVPLISYMLLDRRELILGFYRSEHVSVDTEIYVAVTEPVIVALFSDYFDTLWRAATILKEGERPNMPRLLEIGSRLGVKLPEYLTGSGSPTLV